jgi:hypothetical protein
VHSDIWNIQGNEVCYQSKEGRPYVPYGTEHRDLLKESCSQRGFEVGLYDNGNGFSIWGKDNRQATGVEKLTDM